MVGFLTNDLTKHLETLSTDTHMIDSITELWNSNHYIKELCTLPLNMMMLLSIIKNGEGSDFNTRTEIYSAFMNVTVKHFVDRHPGWNTVSLWECILKYPDSHNNKLCKAFKELHHVAFEMYFNQADKFSVRHEINSEIDKFGFVNVAKVDSNGNEVRYTFYHPTFKEFFAAIHLLDLKQEELLYLYIKERQKLGVMSQWQRKNPWLFYFGLIGEHFTNDSVFTSLKQLSMYQRVTGTCPPYCYDSLTFEYTKEIGWTGKKLNKLLGSAGIIVNSTLCVDFSHDTLQYIIDHNVFNKLRLMSQGCSGYLYLEGNATSYAQSESLKSCISGHMYYYVEKFAMLGLLRYPVRFKDLWYCLNMLGCWYKIVAATLHSLHIHLMDDNDIVLGRFNFFTSHNIDINSVTRTVVLTAIEDMGKSLQSLNLTFGPLHCEDLSPYISFLNNISSQFVQELEILIKPQVHDMMKNDLCLTMLMSLFNKIKHLNKLQKLAFIGVPRWIVDDDSLAKSLILQDVCTLNELQTLEIHSVGGYEVQRLSWCLPHTLQKLNLCENNITDHNVNVIAQGLKDLHKLKSLRLCENLIRGGSLRSLVDALKSHQNFSSLDLSYNPINNSDNIKALGNLRNLRELKLTGSRVDVTELVNVLLSNNITLHSLSITGNMSIGIKSLLPIGQLTDLHHLDISGYQFEMEIKTPYETNMLVEMLKNLTKLESFYLCNYQSVALKIHWSIDLARVISRHLPRLWLFYAPCLHTV